MELIKDMRWKGCKRQFIIRWDRYGSDEDTCTWELEEKPLHTRRQSLSR